MSCSHWEGGKVVPGVTRPRLVQARKDVEELENGEEWKWSPGTCLIWVPIAGVVWVVLVVVLWHHQIVATIRWLASFL